MVFFMSCKWWRALFNVVMPWLFFMAFEVKNGGKTLFMSVDVDCNEDLMGIVSR